MTWAQKARRKSGRRQQELLVIPEDPLPVTINPFDHVEKIATFYGDAEVSRLVDLIHEKHTARYGSERARAARALARKHRIQTQNFFAESDRDFEDIVEQRSETFDPHSMLFDLDIPNDEIVFRLDHEFSMHEQRIARTIDRPITLESPDWHHWRRLY